MKSTFIYSRSKRRALEQDVKSTRSWQLRYQNEAKFFCSTVFIFNFEDVFSVLTLNRWMRAAIQRWFSRKVFHEYLDILQENIHVEVWPQLYWNHISTWVFCKYATYLQQNVFFREQIWRTASVYRSKYRGYKCTGSP